MGRWTQRAHELAARGRDTSSTPDNTDRIDRIDTTEREDAEIAWRVAAFRAAIPAHGPIWSPRIRNTPQTNMPDHCSLCGDELPVDLVPRFPRCAPCVRALTLALHEVREGVRA